MPADMIFPFKASALPVLPATSPLFLLLALSGLSSLFVPPTSGSFPSFPECAAAIYCTAKYASYAIFSAPFESYLAAIR